MNSVLGFQVDPFQRALSSPKLLKSLINHDWNKIPLSCSPEATWSPVSGCQAYPLVSRLLGRSRTSLIILLLLEPPSHLLARSHARSFIGEENSISLNTLSLRPKEVGGGLWPVAPSLELQTGWHHKREKVVHINVLGTHGEASGFPCLGEGDLVKCSLSPQAHGPSNSPAVSWPHQASSVYFRPLEDSHATI